MQISDFRVARFGKSCDYTRCNFYDKRLLQREVVQLDQCQTMQAASLTRELCRQQVCTHSLVCRTGAAPHPLMLRGSTDAATPARRSEDRMHNSGAVSDTIPRLCVTKILSKMHLRAHSDVNNKKVEDTTLWWRSGCSSVGTQRSRAQKAETRKTIVQNAPT